MGKSTLVIGATQQGKTTEIKRIIKRRRCCVFDVNSEYSELPFDITREQCRFFNEDISKFLEVVNNKHSGTVCVFEEATGFFAGGTLKPTRATITKKRHPEHLGGRNLIFVFHTINAVPPFLLDTADYVILKKTGDNPNTVKRKAPKLYPYFLKLQKMPDYSTLKIKNI